ncbi:MAG: AMP-binding protein [Candidatus Omnitrophica bacterium]|nr:AMP-binding protein [Candidatus Omnitrophota bacterium]MBU1922890.1 AMP-binding protein [Candidatus Omnitrophota bacterium]
MVSSLGALLTATAQKYPRKIAVEDRGNKFTYQQLDSYSDSFASSLLYEGLKIGDRAALYTSKSMEGIAAIFGILKAGGVYVPLDVSWPIKRCSFIIDNCQIQYIFTSFSKVACLYEIAKLSSSLKTAILLDNDSQPKIASLPKNIRIITYSQIKSVPLQKPPLVSSSSLASIFYTSGSADKPKGVMMTHQAELASLKNSSNLASCISNNDRYALYHSFSVISSFVDILLIIKCAAVICILPEGTSAFISTLKKFIKDKKISILGLMSDILIQLALYGNFAKGELTNLRMVIIRGKIPVKYLRFLIKAMPKAKIFNNFGSTETRRISDYLIKNILSEKELILSIGRPHKGIETFIVDMQGKRLAERPGSTGELYVYSPSLMSGYWGDPEMTHEVLLKDHFTKKNRMIYRTHDLVRVDRNKNYIILGRIDNIIRVRGFRVGLEEIESALEEHPRIKSAVCLRIPDGQAGNCIKAIVVLKKPGELKREKIVSFLKRYLPIYMIPEIVEYRPSLPRLSSGKIDRQAILSKNILTEKNK